MMLPIMNYGYNTLVGCNKNYSVAYLGLIISELQIVLILWKWAIFVQK